MEVAFFFLSIPPVSIFIWCLMVVWAIIIEKFSNNKIKNEILLISVGLSTISACIVLEILTTTDLSLANYGSIFLASICVYLIAKRVA